LLQPDGFTAGLAGQSVLVTGAGGYIGSALVKRIAAAAPARLTMLDSCEQNLFEIAQCVDGEAILGSVTDARLLGEIFRRSRPSVVLHAAAYKHVPLLESNPFAAVETNAIGTYTLARAMLRHGAGRLVLVSTDKAVYPRSIMGASKRIAEFAAIALSSAECRMNAVRLGNVWGSTGSVVPIFRRQIAEGGPVTVTHRDATRYFLSLDAAVEAILACAAADCAGRVLLPNLGAPMRIEELARSLMGGVDVPIQFTGLRPGDKLSETLVYAEEVKDGMSGPLSVYRSPAPEAEMLESAIERLRAAVTVDELLARVSALVCR
jgi:FlaA1/EpsC-like NDP-sugar epimerase